MKRNIIITFVTVLFGIFALATNAYALPPKPNMPGGPAVPAQPELPPCVECNEVFGTPKPTATPAPHNGGGNNGGGSSSGTGGTSSSTGEVLGLSATTGAADQYAILTVLGMTWVGVGLKLRNRN